MNKGLGDMKNNLQSPRAWSLNLGGCVFAALLLAACGGGGGSSAPAAPAAPAISLQADCSGCGAVNSTTYSGSGVGTWSYKNSSNTDLTFNINIDGVSAGKQVTLAFSNGTTQTAVTTPSTGVLAAPLAEAQFAPADKASVGPVPSSLNAAQDAHDADHSARMAQNKAVVGQLRAMRANSTGQGPQPDATFASVLAPSFAPITTSAPANGSTRTWNDLGSGSTVTLYLTSVQSSCALPSGRNVVFWLDASSISGNLVTAADISAMSTAMCGTGAGFAQINTLLGDVWGAHKFPLDLIQDSPGLLQNINIAIVNAPPSAGWAGYFYSVNNFLKTSSPPNNANSNQALVFFINSNQVKSDRNYSISTLLHEATHMTNFYQRAVLRNTDHDTWLEETSAMMTEDIVVPTVLVGYNKIASYRLPGYLATGGGVSYINWPNLSTSNYNMGGAFGAYLNRKYGLAVYQGLVTNCADSITISGLSYGCLDNLIRSNGGTGFADDFAHFGAAIFSALPVATAPVNYGFPAKQTGSYTLQAIDVSTMRTLRPAVATPLNAGYTATTHSYQLDTVPVGKTSYTRNNVLVPANTTLLLTIQ